MMTERRFQARFLIAMGVVFVAILLEGFLVAHSRTTGERKVTVYPGSCPNGQHWFFEDSDDYSVTVGCYDPDYVEPDEPPTDPSN